jgi:hypothetical protein
MPMGLKPLIFNGFKNASPTNPEIPSIMPAKLTIRPM